MARGAIGAGREQMRRVAEAGEAIAGVFPAEGLPPNGIAARAGTPKRMALSALAGGRGLQRGAEQWLSQASVRPRGAFGEHVEPYLHPRVGMTRGPVSKRERPVVAEPLAR